MKQLRLYQEQAVKAVFDNLEKGISKQLCCVATGGGKTLIATRVAERFKRTLFLCHREELIEQAAIAFLREKFDSGFIRQYVEPTGFINFIRENGKFNYKGFSMGLIKADAFEIDADVVIGSIQTVTSRLDKIDPEHFDCVIIDECHNYMAISYFNAVRALFPKLRLGITATDKRGDNLPLGDLFDVKVFEYNIADGIKDGYLVELDAIRIKTNCSLDNVRAVGAKLNEKDLDNEINTLARNLLIAESYLKYCQGRKFIAFACSIQHALDLCDAFIQKGINCTVISSNEELTGDRTEKVKAFREGKYEGLINVNLITEGADFPFVSCIIAGAPTKSWTRAMQQYGRGTRTLPGIIDGLLTISERWKAIKSSDKKDCIILDIVDNTTKHNIVNCWNLDRELPPEERVFITEEKRQKLLEARDKSTKLDHVRTEDERIKLLAIPRVKISNSIKMTEEASPKQLEWIYSLGYPKDAHYTKRMVSEIINQLPASSLQAEDCRKLGYDISDRVLTRGEVNAIMWDVKMRLEKKQNKKQYK